jgi:DNA repair protein RadC
MTKISEITINYSPAIKKEERVKVTKSKHAETYFREVWSNKMEYIEEIYLMLLNRSNEVLGFTKVSMGGVNSAIVDPKVIFQTALKANASAIIIAHNHCSGSLKPSEQDLRVSNKIREGAGLLDINLLDHIILSSESYFSFADDGLL